MVHTNWAGNITFGAREVHRPGAVDEVRALVAGAGRVRALGSGHSFNRIADTDGELISLAGLPPRVEIDAAASRVTVAGGLRYGDFADRLYAAGFALPNLGSLPHISVAGAVATATHGSGVRNTSLASSVSGLELVTAEGELVEIRRGHPDFAGMVVGLGGFGVVTALTLDLVPGFEIAQYVYDRLPAEEFAGHAQEILGAGYSVSVFTTWRTDQLDQVWVKGPRTQDVPGPRWFGATRADGPRHPVPGMDTRHCTTQLGEPGPWQHRLPHFRMDFTPSTGRELQSEFFVPRANVVAAYRALDTIRDRMSPLVQTCEIRTIAAEGLWLSPAAERDSAAFHFTWIDDTPAVTALLPVIEELLSPFAVRPHWGKLFTCDAATLRTRYDHYADFERLLAHYDPGGKFGNDFLDRHFTRA
ncbi:FAD-binding protein [Nocardia macrotermitis]|uniref:Putative xylitol oxidase n=1 Tax=Nocardia macrotermitis TaxID=2585198 RepID=A0A7K0D900_9NOCA|nr:FAD-binding protein [Nocardia macrotermitis]MQY22021.1 putative xylitol oxidase [Nocardia macrotermitis]